MTEPLVSILIPAYNAQRYIPDAIGSALAQTYPKTEIIVVDDGSSDGTLCEAKRFASSCIHIITQRNQGAAVARNTAFSACRGDYVQWLDADDILDTAKIERQILNLQRCTSKRTLLSGAWGTFAYRIERARLLPSALWCDLDPLEWLYRKIDGNRQMIIENWLVSRELCEAAGPWDARLSNDIDGEYFCRVVKSCDSILFVADSRSYWRKVAFNTVSQISGSHRKLESLFISIKQHIDCLLSMENSPRTRLACITFIHSNLFEFYPYRLDIAKELQQIVLKLGGQPKEPELSWKYNWIAKLFGWHHARKVQTHLPRTKARMKVAWDKAMFRLEKRMRACSPGN